MDNTTVGEIGLNLVLNKQGFSKSLNAVQEQANSVSNNMKSSLKKLGAAIVAAFSVAAIKQFGQQCIESAAQVNAANSQFEQTFGSMESQAKSAIQSVAKESGILETRLQGVGTSIYALQNNRYGQCQCTEYDAGGFTGNSRQCGIL